MTPQQHPAPRRRPVAAIAVAVALTAVVVTAAIIGIAYALGGDAGTPTAVAATGSDPMAARACEAAQRAVIDPDDDVAPFDALAAAGQATDADLLAIHREWTSGEASPVRAAAGVYQVHTWCLNNKVLVP